eukprot:356071-Chlamydomonas_euryale.AAC.4
MGKVVCVECRSDVVARLRRSAWAWCTCMAHVGNRLWRHGHGAWKRRAHCAAWHADAARRAAAAPFCTSPSLPCAPAG